MKKRLFQVLDEMNQHDAENGTRLVTIHPDVVSMNQTKKGTHVTMGVPLGILNISDCLDNKYRLVLMVIDGAEYDKRK